MIGLCWFHTERAGEALPEELRDVGEAAWREVCAWTGRDAEEPLEVPITINLYPKRKLFVAAVESIESGASKDRAAWGDPDSHQIYVKVQPLLGEWPFLEIGIPEVSLRAAAREVAVMAMAQVEGGAFTHPWLREGLAELVAERALIAIGRASAAGAAPADSTALWRVRELARAGRLPTVAEILAGEIGDLGGAERRALHGVWLRYLASREEPSAIVGLAAGEGQDLEEFERGFPAWLEAQTPIWHEETPATAVHGEGLAQTAIRGQNALCWAVEPPPSGSYEIRGEFLLYHNEEAMGQANVLLGLLDTGDYISVAFHTPTGVLLWRYDSALARQGKPAFVALTSKTITPPFAAREWVPFSVRYDAQQERIFVEVAGTRLRPQDTTGRDMSGAWGLGVLPGMPALWRGVECVALDD